MENESTPIKREDQLIQALREVLSKNEIEIFRQYKVSEQELQSITEVAKDILRRIPRTPYACAMMSALWGACIQDNTKVPVAVIAGHLDVNGRRVFQYKTAIPTSTEERQIEQWDGHCWIEFGGHIGDISIFRTSASDLVPLVVRQYIETTFRSGKGVLVASPEYLKFHGLIYTPIRALSKLQIDGLVRGAELLFKKNDI